MANAELEGSMECFNVAMFSRLEQANLRCVHSTGSNSIYYILLFHGFTTL